MEIQYFGGNCVKLSYKKTSLVIDDNLAALGQKTISTDKDIVLFTTDHLKSDVPNYFLIDGPGEYDVSDVSIQGIAARAHMGEEKTHGATIYRIMLEDVRIAVVGHVYPDLSEDQLEALGTIDILIIPVGNSGYTLDGIGAQKVIRKIEPKIVIPTHYAEKGLNYEVPQADLESALKDLNMVEAPEMLDTLKLKNIVFGELVKTVVLKRS